MAPYIAKRIVGLVVVWLLLSVVSFSLLRLAGGSPASVILGLQATPEAIAQINRAYGLNLPLPVQYVRWIAQVVRGDLGQSIFLNATVMAAILSHFGVTASLTLVGFIVAAAIGTGAGIVAAVKRGRVDAIVILASSGASVVPEFLLALALLVLLADRLPLFPAQGYVALTTAPHGWFMHICLPSLAIGLIQGGPLARFVRNALMQTLAADYVRTARAKGMPWRVVLVRHALRSALLPVITAAGLIFTALLGGAFAAEVVFNLPGLGRLLLSSALNRDFPTLQGGVLFVGTLVVLINLLVDVMYGLADPRITYA
jgi:peptide/nickel transport system permease protein